MKFSSKNSGNWLISFGDLLTLLLCLFVANYKVAHTHASSQAPEDIDNYQEVEVDKSHGTHIAKTLLTESISTLSFSSNEFDGGSGELTPKALKRVKSIEIPRGYAVSAVTAKICSEKKDEQGWHQIVTRALTLPRQLIDTAYPEHVIAVEILGADCSLLTGAQDDTVAVIEVRQLKHG